jgi:lipopolysaccharide export system permease protein
LLEFKNKEGFIASSQHGSGSLSEGQLLIESPEGNQVFNFPDSLLFSNIAIEKLRLTRLLELRNNYQLEGDMHKIDSLIFARLFLPISIIAIIFLAGSLMFSNARTGGVGRQIIIGISLGLVYDLLKDLSIASFLTYQWPIFLAHILPIVLLIGLGYFKFQRV